MSRARTAILAAVALALVAAPVAAHVPDFAGGNTTPESAYRVDPPTKSWAIYESLAPDQVRYYELRLAPGDRLSLSLFTPSDGPFAPSFVVMSPAIDRVDAVPDRVTVPDGHGTLVVDGEKAAAPSFEPFTPAANYGTASVEREVDAGGRYLVAVYESSGRAGQVGVVAGSRESFTLAEWLTVAWDLPRVYRWGGAHPLAVVGPPLGVLLAGVAWARGRLGAPTDHLARYLLVAAGLTVVGSATAVLVQLVAALAAAGPTQAAGLPVALVAVPGALGGALVARAADPAFVPDRRDRLFLAAVGLGSLATWAGYVVAPLAVLGLAAAPRRWFLA